MLKDILFLRCQKEDSFGSKVEELKKKMNQTIAGRGEVHLIFQKQRNEEQKWRQQFKTTLFSPRPQGWVGGENQTHIKCKLAEGQNQNLGSLHCWEVRFA